MFKLYIRDYFWNIIAGLFNASEAVILSMIVTRYGSLSDAGIIAFSFGIGNVLMAVAKYGGRNFQVTDTCNRYSFGTYLKQRVITSCFALLLLYFILILGKYSSDKKSATIAITLILLVESIEECFWGRFQLNHMLHIGAKMFSFRWFVIIIIFFVNMYYTHDTIQSLTCGLIGGTVVFTTWVIAIKKLYPSVVLNKYEDKRLNALPLLFRQTTPLFLGSFFMMFLINIPRFAIDYYESDVTQAYYSFISMPLLVMGLLNQFTYQPLLVKISEDYYSGQYSRFCSRVKAQLFISTMIAFVCFVGMFVIGIPFLSLLYNTDLNPFTREFLILQIAGGLLAIAEYFIDILTVMRKQRDILICYFVVTPIDVVIVYWLVGLAGTRGAALGFFVSMVLLLAVLGFCFIRNSKSFREYRMV